MKNKFINAAKKVGFKSPLKDPRLFVGRKREILKLEVCCTGAQVTSVWIWGPRRIGKTSLSYRVNEINEITLLRVNCDKHIWESIDKFGEFIKREINTKGKLKISEKGKNVFNAIAEKSEQNMHIILVLDEFDTIGINLQKFEQAFIRAILQNSPYFGIIFISRLNPSELLQDYSDESSRLLGVCDNIRVPFLERSDIFNLVKIIESSAEIKLERWIIDWIYERISGYSVAVQTLIRELLISASTEGDMPNKEQIESNDRLYFEKLQNELKGIWYDLPLGIRKYFLDDESSISSSTEREMLALNLIYRDKICTPIWIQKIGKNIGLLIKKSTFPEFIELAEKLYDGIRICNDITLRRGNTQIFQVTQQSLRIFDLARPVEEETILNSKISILHKICVENTSSNDLPGKDKCLIPEQFRNVYKKSKGFMTLVAWRNFSFHDPSHDLKPSEKSFRYKNIGEIYCNYLGPKCYRAKNKEDFNTIYKGVLNDICESVTKLVYALENTEYQDANVKSNYKKC